jgi:uncharacterized membrane protein YjjB (DUF3815 family)
MLVPGPHLINGVLDLIDNHLPMSLARLGLAAGILLASTLGILIGVELTLPHLPPAGQSAGADRLTLASDVVLAAAVACGFAVSYNTPWRRVGLAVVGGVAGHGLRYLCLAADLRLEAATFLGALAVGAVSGLMARSVRTPVAVIAFAGALTLMPGPQMYRALGGALQLARQTSETDPTALAAALGDASQACLVVGGLTLGLVLGARAVLAMSGEGAAPKAPSGLGPEAAGARGAGRSSPPSEPANGQGETREGTPER